MTRENLLFGIIGILLGFIVGFMFASTMSQRQQMAQSASNSQPMPADHPQVGGAQGQPRGNPDAVRAQVTADIEKARAEPKNFEAQVTAARHFAQIGRFQQAIEFLLKANEIKPTDYNTVVMLAVANLDAEQYDVAEKWYRAALKMKQDDVMVLAGLAEATLQKRDAKAAEEAIANLEKVDPSSQDLPRFRELLSGLKSGK
ncbi:MAG TPA: tetratricopeptide repeat protein [Pyrinomonadaceae bacterium]|nr:tetratricopeptide repeat protein [Pyrinomonadaceae bacterium]